MKAKNNIIFYLFSENFLKIKPKYKIIFLWLLVLGILPFFTDMVMLDLFMMGNIFLIYATAWDLLSGYTGQESFGHSLFIGVSAYLTGFLGFRLAEMNILSLHLPFAGNLILGALIAALLGLVIGIPSLKLKGPFLALATLSSAALAHDLVMPLSKYTNGEEGMAMPSTMTIDFKTLYYISIVLMFVCVGISYLITRSKYGTLLKAIREDEAAAKAVGINTTKFKVGTFVISAAISGLAGSFHAYYINVVSPRLIDTSLSFDIIIFAVVGGIGTIIGPIGGVYILWILGYFLNAWIPEFKTIVYTVIMIVIMLMMPKGVWVAITEKITTAYRNWKSSRGGV